MNVLSHEEAVAALRRGDVVAVPTDTVYGVAARLLDAAAVRRLFEVKRRPTEVALPVLIESLHSLAALEVDWSEQARALATAFWPGPLTIVVGTTAATAARVGATHTLGVRRPRHPQLAALIAECGPLAVTSANEHGRPPCTNADAVRAVAWGARVAGVLDGGECDGAVSSVVELTASGWRLRRRGAVSPDAIAAILGPEARGDDH